METWRADDAQTHLLSVTDGDTIYDIARDRYRERKWRKVLIGDYDWGFLCTPSLPWGARRSPPPFFEKDEKISLLLALVMGLQHALAMVAGVVTTPVILSSLHNGNFTPGEQQYVVSAAMIVSGLASFIQMTQFRIPYTNYVIGSGMLSVMGVTFAYLPVAVMVFLASKETLVIYALETYQILVTSWFQIALSFCPKKFLKKVFPPVVTGSTIILIGASLITSGFSQWGGGTTCANQVLTSKTPCDGNGEVELPFGDRHYIELGLVVVATLIIVEIFGSPILRNTQVIVGLVVGMAVASSVHVTKCEGTKCSKYRFVTFDKIPEAPWITFLWRYTFPLGIYPPALLPMLLAGITSMVETIGDVSATYEASHLHPSGTEYEKSLQGGVLADGINSVWASLATTLPVVTYAQNNGVISLSGCASRRAGYGCCFWMILFGTCAKFAALILSIPNCILGAMTTFLFSGVMVSGIKLLSPPKGLSRRDRFIVTMALGVGLGVNLVPAWVNISGQSNYPNEGNLWPVDKSWSKEYRGFRDAVIQVLSNGFSSGGLVAVVLNLVIPTDEDDITNLPRA
ncbi:hypothetical protein AXG93_3426s1120 [Marchantia polymorpha subsp. ruderalis]|uniref:Uncharacterized protein n=1 Tax=Marchantia polymorpha subsp. ruderalis TaxID=1480154 RepID=A0A176VBY1_MARPO|nr:hypothetical protein AXG93_3426s1120 [Marchantia polymorpha subsp. ruderalis]